MIVMNLGIFIAPFTRGEPFRWVPLFSLYGGKRMKKELIFIDEETLTPEELEAIADEYETEE